MTQAFVEETARAWRISPKKVAELANWTERRVERHYQARVFAKLLRRFMETDQPAEDTTSENAK